MRPDDEIVIISSENRAPSRPQQQARSSAQVASAPRPSSGGGSARPANRPRTQAAGSRSTKPTERTAPGDLMTGLKATRHS